MMSEEEKIEMYESLYDMLNASDVESKVLAASIMYGLFVEDHSIITEKWFYYLFIFYVSEDNIEDHDSVHDMMSLFVTVMNEEEIKKKVATLLVTKSMTKEDLFGLEAKKEDEE